MRALVVGYGSIGSRHIEILTSLGCQVAVVTSRDIALSPRYKSISEAILDFNPGYVVISTETVRHLEGISELAKIGYDKTLLVEKPLIHAVRRIEPAVLQNCYVAYNLRFHPVVKRMRKLLVNERIVSVQAYVGQYLPMWRPGRDYREVYSADKTSGGGVLRDLSHELDLLNLLLGGWHRLTALGGHFSNLEISSDDTFGIMMMTERCPVVTVQMNYIDRVGQRRLTVITEERTIEADFVSGHILNNDIQEKFETDRDYTYREMHRALLDGRSQDVCNSSDGLDVVRMIDAAEMAVQEGRWIEK